MNKHKKYLITKKTYTNTYFFYFLVSTSMQKQFREMEESNAKSGTAQKIEYQEIDCDIFL